MVPELTRKEYLMTEKHDTVSTPTRCARVTQNESSAPLTKREPYIKPAFRMEKVCVTTALSCGKANDGTGTLRGRADADRECLVELRAARRLA